MDTTDRINAVMGPLQEARSDLNQQREDLLSRLQNVNDEIKRVDRILAIAQPNLNGKPKTKQHSKPSSMAPEKVEAAYEIIRGLKVITAPGLSDASHGTFNRDQATKALSNLREQGRIRFTGWHRAEKQRGLGQKQYELV